MTLHRAPQLNSQVFFSHTSKYRLLVVYKHCEACWRGKMAKSLSSVAKNNLNHILQLRCSLIFFRADIQQDHRKISHICWRYDLFTHLGQFIRNCTINVQKKISPLNAKLAERRPEIAIPSVPLFEGINVPPFSIGFMNFHERFKEFAFDICHNLKIVDILDVALKNAAN